MGYYYMTGTTDTIPITLQVGYRYILRHFWASATGTSSLDTTLQLVKNTSNDVVLVNISTTSTDLTVYGVIDYDNAGASGVNSAAYLASPFEFTVDDPPVLIITNNGSVSWKMTLEEVIA